LKIETVRNPYRRGTDVIFYINLDSRTDFGGSVFVPDKWIHTRKLSFGPDGIIAFTLMTIFSAFWTGTCKEAGLGHWWTRDIIPKKVTIGAAFD
jgi:hypothetical protein